MEFKAQHQSGLCLFVAYINLVWSNLIMVCRHHQHGRWQARIGRVAGNKDLYLGTFSKCAVIFLFNFHIL